MTAAERVEECEEEEVEVPVPVPVPQTETDTDTNTEAKTAEGAAAAAAEDKEECAAEQKEEPATVTVDSVITVETVVEQDGKVEETSHEEVKVKQTFIPEEPMPYGADESLTQEGKEDEEECGFCLFMKAGPCGKRFAAWEACVDDAETAGTNIVEKCAQKTHFLKDCMEANPEYYGPVLQAEKAIDEQATMEAKTGSSEDNSSNLESIPA